jgi:hypothetical protein
LKGRQRCLALASLFLGLALPSCASSAEALQFNPPAPATFLFTSGKQLVGRVSSLDVDRVFCQIDVGVNIYRASRLQAIETADQTFTLNAPKQEWDSARAEMPTPLLDGAKATAAPPERPRSHGSNGAARIETAISEGFGTTADVRRPCEAMSAGQRVASGPQVVTITN